MIFDIILQPYG